MKWLPVPKQSPRHNKENVSSPRPFLVLPRVSTSLMTGGTWPPPPRRPKTRRPSTATLQRPILLDIGLLDKLDMSLVRKEFLCITNLCRSPVAVTSLPASPRIKAKKLKEKETSDTSQSPEEDENSIRSRSKISNPSPSKTKPSPIKKLLKTKSIKAKLPRPAKISRTSTTQSEPSTNVVNQSNTSTTPVQSKILPAPCTTCGRAEHPERFHSHPKITPPPPTKNKETKQKLNIMKNSVQKPLPIKFKSKKTEKGLAEAKKEEKKNEKKELIVNHQGHQGPRTLTCYICGREFGTASLHLHEPKCLQKWERENAELPRHLQRKAPVKPSATSNEEWNKSAWEASQASLVPCPNCARTFLPDRLVVHQRSCKVSQRAGQGQRRTPGPGPNKPPVQDMQQSPGPASPGPPTVRCYICGRMFGTKSIGIHEPQCLKKWHMQNDLLPPSQRLPPPNRSSIGPYPENLSPERPASKASDPSASEDNTPTPAPNKKPTLPCYVCGKDFGVSSIYIHEPQCLKKWKGENEKLPPQQRRPEPQRPDIKFTHKESARGDSNSSSSEDGWTSYLAKLVPCRHCGRTFEPARVDRHQRVCKVNA